MISIWLAFSVDALIGDPYWFPHPVRIIGLYISRFEKVTRKLSLKDKGLKLAGILLTITTVALTYLVVYYLLKLSKGINIYGFYIINILLLWTAIAPKTLMEESMKIYKALKENDIPKARKLLSYIVGRDTTKLSEEDIAKATIETVAENTSDGVIAPLLYMYLGGAPLALAYKAVNTLDSMVGYKNERYLHFGWASAKLDDIANFIPARITGILIVLSSGLVNLDFKNSWKILRRDKLNHSSPNSGFPEAAVAGALNVQLGGANTYFGKVVFKPTIGDQSRLVDASDIKKTNYLMYVSSILTLITMTIVTIAVNYL